MKINSAAQTGTPSVAKKSAECARSNAGVLLAKAHRVLVHYRPGTALPEELSRVRAMLDAHMFGRDTRTLRDEAVETARQIDQILPARAGAC